MRDLDLEGRNEVYTSLAYVIHCRHEFQHIIRESDGTNHFGNMMIQSRRVKGEKPERGYAVTLTRFIRNRTKNINETL